MVAGVWLREHHVVDLSTWVPVSRDAVRWRHDVCQGRLEKTTDIRGCGAVLLFLWLLFFYSIPFLLTLFVGALAGRRCLS